MKEDVSILIPVFNNPADTKQCLEGIFASRVENRTQFKIIVCDDGSDDSVTTGYLAALSDRVQLLRNEVNLGYTKSANRLLGAADTRHAVLMNNDCTVHGDWIDQLVDRLDRDERVALVGTRGRMGRGSDGSVHPIMVMFECVGINMASAQELGHLDERFAPAYYEDDDYNVRALLAGYRLDVVQDSKVIHETPARSYGVERRSALMKINAKKFIEKWRNHPQVALYIRHALFNPYTWKCGWTDDDIACL
jgi:GT2 family glycosyltransferase